MSDSPETKRHEPIADAKIVVGAALAWPLLDQEGRLLLRAGTVITSEEERCFLLEHFSFYAGAPRTDAPQGASSVDGQAEHLAVADMRLSIGSPIGMRSFYATSSPMRRSRIIGFSPDHSLFVTAPRVGKLPLVLTAGENVQAVAIGAYAVYSFSCTVLAACGQPFHYLVLSAPGAIRMLRERKATRVQTRLAVTYREPDSHDARQGLGLGRDLSVQGMSLVAPRAVGEVGARVHVSFPISTAQIDTEFDAVAVVRNVKDSRDADGLVAHGLEFESMSGEQQFALRLFLFDWMNANSL
ncbi:flagellar brake protein [Trinickia dinghuensis]|uniref:Flagellar brake protein n=1 Tax=Trinickia dinghuensis TaxID=2291023 RepID=A0A3D8K3E5_9BURK|nr:flagellar brake protein [Trinickia dinghuensis]RDU99395.1 flagellar brake protein [Trinickia dinghuensis]